MPGAGHAAVVLAREGRSFRTLTARDEAGRVEQPVERVRRPREVMADLARGGARVDADEQDLRPVGDDVARAGHALM